MRPKLKKLAAVLPLFCLLLFSCKKEETIPNPIRVSTESPFAEYVDRFFEEAEKRDANISRADLTVTWMDDASMDVCGYGYSNYNNTGARRVEIKPVSFCWEDRNDFEKEGLMFHELGHAVLGRNHVNNRLGNGLERSMMCGGNNGCNQFALYSQYTPDLRTYYLDELFNQQVAIPEWSKVKTNPSIFLESAFDGASDSWTFFNSNGADNYQEAIEILESDSSTILTIESKKLERDSDIFSGWRHRITKPDLPETATLKLTAIISAEAISGQGVSVVLRTDSGLGTNRTTSGFGSTQGEILINGTFDKKEFSTQIGYIPSDIEDLFIFLLLLPETRGKVSFHNIKLTVLE